MKREFLNFLKNRQLFMLTLPGIAAILVFNYIPMFGLIVAFKNYTYDKGILGSDWVGFDNFKFFFTSQYALRVTRNTLLYNAAFIVVGILFAVIFALLLNELSRKAVKVYQTVFLMPYFLSWVVISYIVYALLNYDSGAVNKFLEYNGHQAVMWYNEPQVWPVINTLFYLWKNVGYTCVIFYTGLIGIDVSYYEAAQIDGASKFQQVWKVSIPLLRPLIIIMVLLAVGKIFYSDFGLFYFLPRNSGSLLETTDVIDTYVYRSLRVSGDMGMSAAAGFYQSIVGFLLVLLSNRIVSKIDKDSSIF